MVANPVKPRSSACLAQSVSKVPGVPGTGFGNPIPIFIWAPLIDGTSAPTLPEPADKQAAPDPRGPGAAHYRLAYIAGWSASSSSPTDSTCSAGGLDSTSTAARTAPSTASPAST